MNSQAIIVVAPPPTSAARLPHRAAAAPDSSALAPEGPFTALKIEVDRNDTQGIRFLAVDTEPDYIDTVRPAPGQTAIYKYRAIYLLGDEEYGQWSDWVEITMRG